MNQSPIDVIYGGMNGVLMQEFINAFALVARLNAFFPQKDVNISQPDNPPMRYVSLIL